MRMTTLSRDRPARLIHHRRRPGEGEPRRLLEETITPKGEEVIVHRCRGCGFERHNRVAADDSYDAVAALPVVEPRF